MRFLPETDPGSRNQESGVHGVVQRNKHLETKGLNVPRIPELEKFDDEEVWLVPCDCQSNHYFKFVWWNEEPEMRYANIEFARGNPGWGFGGIAHRIKDALKAFRSNEYVYADIVLNEKSIGTFREFLDSRPRVFTDPWGLGLTEQQCRDLVSLHDRERHGLNEWELALAEALTPVVKAWGGK
jgi:hypothetical protein